MTTKQEKLAQHELRLEEMADKLREVVAEIEGKIPTTKGHYGTYMTLFSQYTGTASEGRLLAKVLKVAGANAYGVDWALHICYGG